MASTEPRAVLPFADRFTASRNGLPKPTAWIRETVRIPLRDGVELGADLYSPVVPPKGVVLTTGPYGRGGAFAMTAARLYAAQGYTVLFVSSRGTADSGGSFDPMRDEAADGHDVVAWMRQQEWYQGRFATVGSSYLGHTQWALLHDPEPDHVAAIVAMGPHDFSRHAWGTGSFNLDLIGWTEQIAAQRRYSIVRAMIALMTASRRLRPVLEATPLADAAVAHFGDEAPWLRDRLTRSDLSDPYWAPMQHAAALENATIPVLVQGGWQDIFLRQSVEQHRRLRERGVESSLTIGPWTHLALTGGALRVLAPQALAWLDRHLAGRTDAAAVPRVHVHVGGAAGGAGAWRDLDEWPPPATERVLHLHPDSRLAPDPAGSDAAPSTFRYDPADPTPTVGGPIIAGGGFVDDSALATRADVLAYDSEPLPADLAVLGAPRVRLAHDAEHPDADLFVRLSDVDAKGRSRNVTEGFVRAAGGNGAVTLELLPTAHVFRAGHRVRLIVAGGSFPQFARSAGDGSNPLTATALHPSRHTVAHASGASTLALPVDESGGLG